ncbi:hypothetical protein ABT390_35425 [Streptomyces aurantiacus]|uniref:Uncharacterized protein n=1 Tax=Streptomyces aurantiacus JA 4570 TaxID=1286094 RepID=S3ZE63_9ACTN|nr:hypothetical protein [Streptomyces aurantiacus]EPH40949.1 hypothetical protein STRAU_5991 [Streptomyces aurantiacus JA 4570]
MDVPRPARTAGGIFHRLDAEWAVLCADPAVRDAVADWLMADHLADGVAAATDGVADSWVRGLGPAQVLAALRPRRGRLTDELADAVLRALLRRAAGADRSATLAARVIVQAMIPAAVRMARGQVRPFGGRCFDHVASVTVAGLFEVARSGRIHTRPGRPAANLALDTLRYVCAELAADHEEHAEDLAAAECLPDTAPGPARAAQAGEVRAAAAVAGLTYAGPVGEAEAGAARLELLELVLDAMDAGALSPADGRAIAWHYTAAVPDTKAAARAGTTAGAWQRRRSRAVARLTAAAQLRPAA